MSNVISVNPQVTNAPEKTTFSEFISKDALDMRVKMAYRLYRNRLCQELCEKINGSYFFVSGKQSYDKHFQEVFRSCFVQMRGKQPLIDDVSNSLRNMLETNSATASLIRNSPPNFRNNLSNILKTDLSNILDDTLGMQKEILRLLEQKEKRLILNLKADDLDFFLKSFVEDAHDYKFSLYPASLILSLVFPKCSDLFKKILSNLLQAAWVENNLIGQTLIKSRSKFSADAIGKFTFKGDSYAIKKTNSDCVLHALLGTPVDGEYLYTESENIRMLFVKQLEQEKNGSSTVQNLIEEILRKHLESMKNSPLNGLDEDEKYAVIDRFYFYYLQFVQDSRYDFDVTELVLAAILFKKKMKVVTLDDNEVAVCVTKTVNPHLPGDAIVIYLQDDRFFRCEFLETADEERLNYDEARTQALKLIENDTQISKTFKSSLKDEVTHLCLSGLVSATLSNPFPIYGQLIRTLSNIFSFPIDPFNQRKDVSIIKGIISSAGSYALGGKVSQIGIALAVDSWSMLTMPTSLTKPEVASRTFYATLIKGLGGNDRETVQTIISGAISGACVLFTIEEKEEEGWGRRVLRTIPTNVDVQGALQNELVKMCFARSNLAVQESPEKLCPQRRDIGLRDDENLLQPIEEKLKNSSPETHDMQSQESTFNVEVEHSDSSKLTVAIQDEVLYLKLLREQENDLSELKAIEGKLDSLSKTIEEKEGNVAYRQSRVDHYKKKQEGKKIAKSTKRLDKAVQEKYAAQRVILPLQEKFNELNGKVIKNHQAQLVTLTPKYIIPPDAKEKGDTNFRRNQEYVMNPEVASHIKMTMDELAVAKSVFEKNEAEVHVAQKKVSEKFAKQCRVDKDGKSTYKDRKTAEKNLDSAHQHLQNVKKPKNAQKEHLNLLEKKLADLNQRLYEPTTPQDTYNRVYDEIIRSEKVEAQRQQNFLAEKEGVLASVESDMHRKFKNYKKRDKEFKLTTANKEFNIYSKARAKYVAAHTEVNAIKAGLQMPTEDNPFRKFVKSPPQKGPIEKAYDKASKFLGKTGFSGEVNLVTISAPCAPGARPSPYSTSNPTIFHYNIKPTSKTAPSSYLEIQHQIAVQKAELQKMQSGDVQDSAFLYRSGPSRQQKMNIPTLNSFATSFNPDIRRTDPALSRPECSMRIDFVAFKTFTPINPITNSQATIISTSLSSFDYFHPFFPKTSGTLPSVNEPTLFFPNQEVLQNDAGFLKVSEQGVSRNIKFSPKDLGKIEKKSAVTKPKQSLLSMFVQNFLNPDRSHDPYERIEQNTIIFTAHAKPLLKGIGAVLDELRSFGRLNLRYNQEGKIEAVFSKTVAAQMEEWGNKHLPQVDSRVEFVAGVANSVVLESFIFPFFPKREAASLIDKILKRPVCDRKMRITKALQQEVYKSEFVRKKVAKELFGRNISKIEPVKLPYLEKGVDLEWFMKYSPKIDRFRRIYDQKGFHLAVRRTFAPQKLSELSIRRTLRYSGFKTYPRPEGLTKDFLVEFGSKDGSMTYRKLGTTPKQNILIRVSSGLEKENVVSSIVDGRIKHGVLQHPKPYVLQYNGKKVLTIDGKWILRNVEEGETRIPLEDYKFISWE